MNPIPALSFCMTCKNRFYQIEQTLRKNLDDNLLHRELMEFVLVDFGSSDGLREWIVAGFQTELASGYLKYYCTDGLSRWHASVAKNTAHLYASGDILVNLDCDNFTGIWGGAYVMKAFALYGDGCVVHQFGGTFGDGSYGRISVKKKYFDMIGGYDESLEPMGYQDKDLINRLTAIGLKYVSLRDVAYNRAIPNTKEESIAHTGSSKNYQRMLDINTARSHVNLSEGQLIANSGRFGICEGLFDHAGQPVYPKLKPIC